jgi:hypothetical protein
VQRKWSRCVLCIPFGHRSYPQPGSRGWLVGDALARAPR